LGRCRIGFDGNDTVTGGNSAGNGVVQNLIFGDAASVFGSVQGGNDTLIAGTQSGGGTVMNDMWGDWEEDTSGLALTGHDTFICNGNFGNQT